MKYFYFLFIPLMVACSGKVNRSQQTIVGVIPLGNVPAVEVDSMKAAIHRMYDLKVVELPGVPLPEMAFTKVRSPRYRADSIVRWLPSIKPDSVSIIVGLTVKDISITKYQNKTGKIKEPEWKYRDFGIFGLGQLGGKSCLISSYRLHGGVGEKGFYKRFTRIGCHEVGHVLGLPHCPEKNCLMNDANESIKTLDNSTGDLCKACWNKIHN